MDKSSAQPKTSRPETFRPETSRPETSRPETFRPETSRPGTSRPETSQPASSEQAQTGVLTPDSSGAKNGKKQNLVPVSKQGKTVSRRGETLRSETVRPGTLRPGSSAPFETISFPDLSDAGNLRRYLEQIKRFPILDANEEYMLARRWKDHGDKQAAQRLITSHLRLVAKIAYGYRGYGLPLSDLIAEGNVGMMQAVRRFDPDKGFRLATYAMWWIRASVQDYVLRSWSVVKIATTAARKKLFFSLRSIKHRLELFDQKNLSPKDVETIASALDVSTRDVEEVNAHFAGGDQSLNAVMSTETAERIEFQDKLQDERPLHDEYIIDQDEQFHYRQILEEALKELKGRERDIFLRHRLDEPPATLEALSRKYQISRERVRQIEARAFEKIQKMFFSSENSENQRG